jgi:hypothetical protein
MGQTESNLKGYTFAYIASAYSNTRSSNITEQTQRDLLFSQPEAYGLRPSLCFSAASSAKIRERPDSGYISPVCDENMHIVNDLAYIDTTYYPLTNTSTESVDDDRQDITRGAQISFTDVMLASPDKTLREVYLSLRSIHSLSPNIGMLTMIRKLDL